MSDQLVNSLPVNNYQKMINYVVNLVRIVNVIKSKQPKMMSNFQIQRKRMKVDFEGNHPKLL